MDLAPGYQGQRIRLLDYLTNSIKDLDSCPFQSPEQRYKRNRYLGHHERYQDPMFADLRKDFWNISCSFVLQIREINLLTGNPIYEGERLAWPRTVERARLRDCAIAAYIYSTSNLSLTEPPTLAFRQISSH